MLTKEMLRSLREQKGLTGKQVAEGIGIAYPVYQTYESGARNAGLPVVEKLADFYGVTTDYLLGREPAPEPFADLGLDQSAEKAVLECYMLLDQKTRAILLDTLRRLASEIPDPEPEESTPEIVETTTIGAELDRRAASDGQAEETAV